MDEVIYHSKLDLKKPRELSDLILELKANIEELQELYYECNRIAEDGFDRGEVVAPMAFDYLDTLATDIKDQYSLFESIVAKLIGRNYLTDSEARELREPVFELRNSDDGTIRMHILY